MGRLMIAVALLAILSTMAGTAFAQEPTPTPTPAATATPTPTATPGRLRNFGLEGYFEPLPIAPPDPSAQALFSPMDLRLIARSAITFWNMINFGGWLSWVGAFTVAGMAIIGLIRVIFFREGL
ncbi:MAG: hypothetical protein RQ897_02285 [Thermoflexus sp.]|jgi:hypothetical protein|nr:hypothetical protein [Thermoflexus sp.]MDT7947158.1 hypothetical protein [Thermoflexus sp.]